MLRRRSNEVDGFVSRGLADLGVLVEDDSIALFATREAIVGAITCFAVAILFL